MGPFVISRRSTAKRRGGESPAAAGLAGNSCWFARPDLNEDISSDVEILVTDSRGGTRVAARITNVFAVTIRLHAAKRMLYMTRGNKGTNNVYGFSFDTGAVTAVTQNAMPGVTFSGLQPTTSHGMIGVREERREDIWLIQQTATPPPGSPAGR